MGERCQLEDPCHSGPCAGRSVCQSSVVAGTAQFYCRCPRGFRGKGGSGGDPEIGKGVGHLTYSFPVPPGPDCSLPDPCLSSPCAHGGRCSVGPDGRYICSCPPGYQGRNCRSDVDECRAGGPCHHGGTCLNTPGSFRCQCPAGYMGPRCENPAVPCAPSPCRNGGTCRQNGDLTYDCACLPGEEAVLGR